jgi:hypothetical protein
MKKQFFIFCLTFLTSTSFAAQVCKSYVTDQTPNSRYTINVGTGTVMDNETGLMWQQCSFGRSDSNCNTGGSVQINWQGALQAAEVSDLGSYTDWRLPNIRELLSLVAYNCHEPSINQSVFPNTATSEYWSSSPVTSTYLSGTRTWLMNFGGGVGILKSRDSTNYVRLVR